MNEPVSPSPFRPEPPAGKPLSGKKSALVIAAILAAVLLFYATHELLAPSPSVRGSSQRPGITRRLPGPIHTPAPETLQVLKNETFSAILGKNRVPAADIVPAVSALRAIYRKGLFEGQEYAVARRPDSSLMLFTLFTRDRCSTFTVSRDTAGFHAELSALPIERRIAALTGILTSSLYESISRAGERPDLIENLIDLYAWDINWFLDPRPGDTFQVVFEKIYAGGRFVRYGEIRASRYVNNGRSFLAYYFDDPKCRGHYNERGVSLRKSFLKAPLAYRRISSRFSHSRLHPVLNIRRPHLGVDYAADRGTPVKAAGNGTVSYAAVKGGYGLCVRLNHHSGWASYYGHLAGFARGIRAGRSVQQGDIIGYVGSTGMSTGPHLDYRLTRYGKFVNPLSLPSIPLRQVPLSSRPAFDLLREQMDAALLLDVRTRYASAE